MFAAGHILQRGHQKTLEKLSTYLFLYLFLCLFFSSFYDGPFWVWNKVQVTWIQLTLHVCQTLISFHLKLLTVQQQGDKALIVEIKISLLPSIQWVVNGEVMWWVGENCIEVFRRDIVLSVTSKCWYGFHTSRHWVKTHSLFKYMLY